MSSTPSVHLSCGAVSNTKHQKPNKQQPWALVWSSEIPSPFWDVDAYSIIRFCNNYVATLGTVHGLETRYEYFKFVVMWKKIIGRVAVG